MGQDLKPKANPFQSKFAGIIPCPYENTSQREIRQGASPKAFVSPADPNPNQVSAAKSEESSIPSSIVTATGSAESLSYSSDQPQLLSAGTAESAASWRKIKT